jgi:glutamyl/glutaminyl-tRNA synthetase
MFDLKRVSKSPAIFDEQKLDWFNNQYIRSADLDGLADLAIPHLDKDGLDGSGMSRDWLKYVLSVIRDELTSLESLPGFFRDFLVDSVQVDQEALAHLQLDTTPLVLDEFVRRLHGLSASDTLIQLQEQSQQLLKQLNKDLKKDSGVSGKAVFMPIRVAITGSVSGQELYYLIPILGVDKVCRRIEASRLKAGI